MGDCSACTPDRRCARHLLALLSTPHPVPCCCCGKTGTCDCEIGAITDKWVRHGRYRGDGVICLTHFKVW